MSQVIHACKNQCNIIRYYFVFSVTFKNLDPKATKLNLTFKNKFTINSMKVPHVINFSKLKRTGNYNYEL